MGDMFMSVIWGCLCVDRCVWVRVFFEVMWVSEWILFLLFVMIFEWMFCVVCKVFIMIFLIKGLYVFVVWLVFKDFLNWR